MAKATKAAPAAAATAATAPATVPATTTTAPVLLTFGKGYNPKANSGLHSAAGVTNAACWAAIQAALQAGPQTLAQLTAISKAHGNPRFANWLHRQGKFAVYTPPPANP